MRQSDFEALRSEDEKKRMALVEMRSRDANTTYDRMKEERRRVLRYYAIHGIHQAQQHQAVIVIFGS